MPDFDPLVSDFIQKNHQWKSELRMLRDIVLEAGLSEAYKWNTPCYMHNGKNILLLGSFKKYCSMSFLQGALLSDPDHMLQSPGPNSKSVRMAIYTESASIEKDRNYLLQCISEAVSLAQQGAKIPKTKEVNYPKELAIALESDADFRRAFEALTPGRRRGYALYIGGAKQAQIRVSRIEKYRTRILDGFGIHDCVCGQSQNMPRCDGSHKNIV